MTDCTVCEECHGQFDEDPFPVTVVRRGQTWHTDYCSATCGLRDIERIQLTSDFVSVSIGPIDAYDMGTLQRLLKGLQ